MLAQRFPEKKFEVFNTGSVAINSHVSLLVAKGLAKLQPDFVIVYSGNNEVVGPYGPGTVLSSSGMWLPMVRASIWFRSTRDRPVTDAGLARKSRSGAGWRCSSTSKSPPLPR